MRRCLRTAREDDRVLVEEFASRAALATFCENYTGLPFAGRIHH